MINDTERFASCRIASICDLTFPLLSVKAMKQNLIPFPVILQRLLLKSVLSIVSLEVCSPLQRSAPQFTLSK
jgi:hypothetical protein